MTLFLGVLVVLLVAFVIALGSRNQPPGPTAGQWINDQAYREAIRKPA